MMNRQEAGNNLKAFGEQISNWTPQGEEGREVAQFKQRNGRVRVMARSRFLGTFYYHGAVA